MYRKENLTKLILCIENQKAINDKTRFTPYGKNKFNVG